MAVATFFIILLVFPCVFGNGSVCMRYNACHDDLYLDWSLINTYNSRDEERSASTCVVGCLRRDPAVQLVTAKLVNVDELLMCGCGSMEALGNMTENLAGQAKAYKSCYVCPDNDNQKCGSDNATSTYVFYHLSTDQYCPFYHLDIPDKLPPIKTTTLTTTTTTISTTEVTEPYDSNFTLPSSLTFLGCYSEMKVNDSNIVTVYIEGLDAGLELCSWNCLKVYPNSDLILVKLLNTDKLYCGCGQSDTVDLTSTPRGNCDRYCDGEDPVQCGGWTSVSAYVRNGGEGVGYGTPRPWILMWALYMLSRAL